MAADLKNFLLDYLDRPFVWGADDCSLMVADWWRANHGTDPAAHLRGTYATEAQKADVLTRYGGLVALVTGLAEGVGAVRSAGNEDGAFGIVRLADGAMMAAIRTGRYWAIRSESGVVFAADARLVRGWSV